NFGAVYATPGEADWANLREAQRRAVAADAHAALVVTIDIGEPGELHPPDKQDVGRRLARAARHLIYGEAITPSGPQVESVHRAGGKIVIRFASVDGALSAYSAAAPTGFELCGATGPCRFVAAAVAGAQVTLDDDPAAARVRYCWGAAPVCNIHDNAGLPAGPFEASIQ